MTIFRALAVLACGLACVTGCGDETEAPDNPVLGCDEGHSCLDYGSAFSQVEAGADCQGDVLQGPCGTSNIVGSCQVQVSSFSLTRYYYPSGYSAMTAETACADSGGTFSN